MNLRFLPWSLALTLLVGCSTVSAPHVQRNGNLQPSASAGQAATDAQPAFQAVFTQNRPGFETLRVAFYPYDASFMQAAVGTDTTMLVNKRDVANLQTYLDGLVAAEPTATPAASAAP